MKMKLTSLVLALAIADPAAAQQEKVAPASSHQRPPLMNRERVALSNPKISKFDGETFTIEHDGGVIKISWAEMPEPWRVGYELNSVAARAERTAANKSILRYHSLREVETAQPAFVGKLFTTDGILTVSAYFNWGYRKELGNMYAFKVDDGTATATFYGLISDPRVAALRTAVLAAENARKPLMGLVALSINSSRYDKASFGGAQFDLKGYHLRSDGEASMAQLKHLVQSSP